MLALNLVSAILVVSLAWAIRSEQCADLDRRLMSHIDRYRPASEGKARKKLDTAMRDITSLGGDVFSTLLLLNGTAILLFRAGLASALPFVALVVGARFAGLLLKQAIARSRPPASGHALDIFTSSFPSVHTAMGFVSAFALAFFVVFGAQQGGLALAVGAVVSAVIGATRLYFAVHWPLDIVAGWLLGLCACTAALYWLGA